MVSSISVREPAKMVVGTAMDRRTLLPCGAADLSDRCATGRAGIVRI